MRSSALAGGRTEEALPGRGWHRDPVTKEKRDMMKRKALVVLAAAGFTAAAATAVHADEPSDAIDPVPAAADAQVLDGVFQVTWVNASMDQTSESNTGANFAGNFSDQWNGSHQ